MGSIAIEDLPSTVTGWKAPVLRKQQERAKATPAEWLLSDDFLSQMSGNTRVLQQDVCRRSGQLSEAELDITEKRSAQQLVIMLQSGAITSLEVTTAFCKRAAIGQQLLSCLTEVGYSEALQRAKALDEHFKTTGKPVGPLHGLPISVKDCFQVKGLQATAGYVSFLEHPPSDVNSSLVQLLFDLGAVLYVKTNIPQTMMTADSENNVFGRTLNPHNTILTAGGSSGGEGSLVGFRGSILGVGTDIAGSIRIPSLCCGVYGFKPTSSRVPYGGQVTGDVEGLPNLTPCAGPLAHSLEDIDLFLRTILSAPVDNYDSSALVAPWRSVSVPQRLRIGVLPEEAVIPLQPPVRRALAAAVKALQEAGHEIVELPQTKECSISLASRLAFAYYTYGPDGSKKFFDASGEPMVASLAARHNPLFSGPIPIDENLDIFSKMEALHAVRTEYEESWRKFWVDQKIDVIVCPPAQNTAVPHDTYGFPAYTQIWNVLDYPACVIPYGKANKELDPSPVAEDNFGPQPQYVPEAVDGAPCSVQVVTRKMRDEECLAAAKVIDEALKKFTPPNTF